MSEISPGQDALAFKAPKSPTKSTVHSVAVPVGRGSLVPPQKRHPLQDIVDVERARRVPEIIANPRLENTRMVISTPLRNEMTNGFLPRHMNAFLRQRLPENTSIELNYLVNGGLSEDNIHATQFIRRAVGVQRLARELQQAKPSEREAVQVRLDAMIGEEQDVLLQKVLRLAARRADHIAISGVNDMTASSYDMNYPTVNIDRIRTVGMDYAERRLEDPDAIFHMYDVDTVPENNNYVRNLLGIYDVNPQLTYVFTNLAHLPAGQDQALVSDSPSATSTGYYSRGVARGSPQITFRVRGAERMKGIVRRSWKMDEDRDSSYRLVGLFGDDQKDVLKLAGAPSIPTSLASDREGGFVDGRERLKRAANRTDERLAAGDKNGIDFDTDSMKYFLKERLETLEQIETLPEGQRNSANEQMARLRKDYERKQRVQSRFNRSVVQAFLGCLDTGEVQITEGVVIIDDRKLLQRPFGQATLMYVRANQELIQSLSQEDLQLMRYYTGHRTRSSEGAVVPAKFPEGMTELSPFQRAIREYIGEYDPSVIQFSDTDGSVVDMRGLDVMDKRTVYEPFLAEMLANATFDSSYFRDNAFLARTSGDKNYDFEAPKELVDAYPKRRRWIDKQLGLVEKASSRLGKVTGFVKRMGYPVGSLLESALKKK